MNETECECLKAWLSASLLLNSCYIASVAEFLRLMTVIQSAVASVIDVLVAACTLYAFVVCGANYWPTELFS